MLKFVQVFLIKLILLVFFCKIRRVFLIRTKNYPSYSCRILNLKKYLRFFLSLRSFVCFKTYQYFLKIYQEKVKFNRLENINRLNKKHFSLIQCCSIFCLRKICLQTFVVVFIVIYYLLIRLF